MFPNSFKQDGFGVEITRYEQTPIILASRNYDVPPGCKRVEALLCGGGGGGTNDGTQFAGGGFGGLQVFVIPQTGKNLTITIGAGGVYSARGGTTSISSAGTVLAATGGGGGAAIDTASVPIANGLFGGSGGGVHTPAYHSGGRGGEPHSNTPIWSALDAAPGSQSSYLSIMNTALPAGAGGNGNVLGQKGHAGGGGGGGGGNGISNGAPGGGSAYNTTVSASYGGGGSQSATGGSLTSVSIWGLTGFAASATNGHGGGGMLAASTGGNGGNGGGGAGSVGGNGGNGFAVLRFYF